ncbi:nitroreductase family protein [Agilicoccus flavus]|uniref:nitroreductase family protein n=1 Tax=Agilicoccus flavus TaxID=2775968 RepID=UPI001CF6C113|nr:nitroreductase family protein [Agilicoccus flavus]
MEFEAVVRRRRMVRRFDPDAPLDPEALRRIVARGLRGPSAGFSQGLDLLVLRHPDDRARFWAAASDRPGPADAWLAGVSAAPALVLVLADPGAYRDRYARPDKADRPPPFPYWDVDAGMGALLVLLSAVDEGWGALFFGVPTRRHARVLAEFDAPADRRLVGVLALGHPAADARRAGGSSHTRRRPDRDRLHVGRFGRPLAASEGLTGPTGSPVEGADERDG